MDKQKIILGVLLVVLAAMSLKYCDRQKIRQITDKNLTKDEQTAIIVDPTTGSVTTIRRNRKDKKGTTQVERPIDGSRDIRIGVSPEGRVKFIARTKGYIFEPGIGIGFDGDALLSLDTQFYFFRRWGALGGVSIPTTFKVNRLSLFAGVSYQPHIKYFSNTSVYVGYNTHREIQFGARVRF